MNARLEPQRLTASDLSDNVALSRSVGWKDSESEWRVLHEAARVWGVRAPDGRLVAQGALGDYGSASSLAKMVVAQDAQRQGLGRRLLVHLLEIAGKQPVGLVATDFGLPLYRAHGFEQTGEVVVLFGSANAGIAPELSVVPVADAETLVVLDREFCGCDRGKLLRARKGVASVQLALESERGFALADTRSELSVLGPIMAAHEAGARALAFAALSQLSGPVRVDVPAEHVDFIAWLSGLGLREVARRAEMARGAARMPWHVPARFALAAQAWG